MQTLVKITLSLMAMLLVQANANASLGQFVGTWKNVDQNTRGVTKVRIIKRGQNMFIRTWGSCSPSDCDWGREDLTGYASTVSDNLVHDAKALTAVYDQGFSEKLVVLKPKGQFLIAEVFSTYNGGRTNHVAKYRLKKNRRPQRRMPDLVVKSIARPQWLHGQGKTVITAIIKNIGNATAQPSIARLIDSSTFQSTGAPYNSIDHVQALAPGQQMTVTFELPYWVYNPDAEFDVTADYKGMVNESNESNNKKDFFELG